MIIHVATLALLLGFVAPVQAADLARGGPEHLAAAFVDAWNSHEPARFEALFTKDAVWVPTADARLDGRAGITTDLRQAHATWARRTTMAIDPEDVTTRAVAPGVSVVLFQAPFRGEMAR